LTAEVGIADVEHDDLLTLSRLNTNDPPKRGNGTPSRMDASSQNALGRAVVDRIARCPICLSNESLVVRPYRARLPRTTGVFVGLWIRRCTTCSACFAHPVPGADALRAFYAAEYRAEGSPHRVEREPGRWDGPWIRARAQYEFVLRHAAFDQVGRVPERWLDIGAGYAFLLDEVRGRGVGTTAGIEPEPHGRRRLTRSGHGAYGTLEDVKGRWDVVSLSHVLEHLPAPMRFLNEIAATLSDEGHVLCEVPNEAHLGDATNDAPHLVFFETRTLTHLFEACSYEVLAVQTCGRKREGGVWGATLRMLTRRVGMRLFAAPPRWLDRALHHHFHYSQSGRQWIRLLARRSRHRVVSGVQRRTER